MLRRANGIASLLLLAVFSAHAIMGALFCWSVASGEVGWVVWVGVCIAVLHVALSIGTTRHMLHDEVRPPSAKKKAHQLKKWISGVLVGVVCAAHVLTIFETRLWFVIVLTLDVALAAHVCVSAKSLVKDLRLAPNLRYVIRVFAIAIAALVGLAFIGTFVPA